VKKVLQEDTLSDAHFIVYQSVFRPRRLRSVPRGPRRSFQGKPAQCQTCLEPLGIIVKDTFKTIVSLILWYNFKYSDPSHKL